MKLRNLLLCLLLVYSCVKSEPQQESDQPNDSVILSVSSLDVKSILDGKKVLWQSDDKISVFDGVSNCLFTTTEEGGSVSFTGKAQAVSSYIALYPYDNSAEYSGVSVKTVFPSEQNLVPGSFAKDANVTIGRTERVNDNHIARMMNVGCYMKFKVESPDSKIVSVQVTSRNGESLAGMVEISFDSSGFPVAKPVDNVSTIIASNGGEVLQTGTYYMTMLPAVLEAGIRVTISMSDGGTRVYELGGLKETERNNVYTLNPAIDYDLIGFVHEELAPVEVIWGDVKPHVRLSVNKADGKFAKNEKIVFSGSLAIEDNMPLAMSVYEEGLLVRTTDIELTDTETVLYECSSATPKSFIVYVHPRGDSSNSLYVGAVVAPEEFRPGFDMPSDFVSYWDEQKSILRSSVPEVTLTPCEVAAEDQDTIEGWYLEISMPEGNPVRGYLAKPKSAKAATLPIFMYFHGAGVHLEGNRAHLDNAVKYAKMGDKGVIALDMNAHGYRDDQPQSYYNELSKGELKEYWQRTLTSRKDYYFRLMCLRMVRALDYLCTLPEWDGDRVMSFGSSQGGYQGAAIAGLDSRVKFALIDVPAHVDIGSPLVGRKAAWPGIYDIAIEQTPELIDDILPYFDGANFLRNTSAKIVCEAGLVDMTCPPGCVFAGFNVCPSTDKTIYCYPYRNHTAADMPEERVYDWKVAVNNKKNKYLQNYLK